MSREAYPSLSSAVGLLLATLVVAGLLAVATLFLSPDWPQIVQMALPTELALVGALVYAVSRTGRPWRDALGLRPIDPATTAPLMLVLVGSVTVFSELYLVIQRIVPVPERFEQMLRELMQINGTVDLVATVAIAVVVAPALEEALFRGVLLQGLTRRRGPGSATLWTAVFFALYHLYNPWQVVPTFFLGLVLGWIVLTTRTLVAAILVHGAFNALSLVLFAAPLSEREPSPEWVPWVAAAIFAILLLGSAAFLVGMMWLERLTGGGGFSGRRDDAAVERTVDDEAEEPDRRYVGEPPSRAGPSTARG